MFAQVWFCYCSYLVQWVKGLVLIQAWWPDLSFQDPQSGRRELTPSSCPLASTWRMLGSGSRVTLEPLGSSSRVTSRALESGSRVTLRPLGSESSVTLGPLGSGSSVTLGQLGSGSCVTLGRLGSGSQVTLSLFLYLQQVHWQDRLVKWLTLLTRFAFFWVPC